MPESPIAAIRLLLAQCTAEERQTLFRELRETQQIHEFEAVIGASAEMILDAIHRAPELTRRMLRGVIADTAFRQFIEGNVADHGWKDITPIGNFAYDYKLDDGTGPITVQVKLQRSAEGRPVVRKGLRYGFGEEIFITETQKSRTGTDSEDKKTRPYRYEEFDILAVSLQPSTGQWDRYVFTLGRWLIQGKQPNEIATMQPVSMAPNEFWTDDFSTAAKWFRAETGDKRMRIEAPMRKVRQQAKKRPRSSARRSK